jgi:hypothetical protein
MHPKTCPRAIPALALAAALLAAGGAAGQEAPSRSHTVLVPLYSEVPFGDATGRQLVRATVVIRNLDPNQSLRVTSAAYYDSDGKRLREYVEAPVTVAPLATSSVGIPETDTGGGITPSMIVRWEGAADIDPPIVEGLMIGTLLNQGISFRTVGRELTAPAPGR